MHLGTFFQGPMKGPWVEFRGGNTLEKVDTLKNVANSSTKSISSEHFFWSTESMGIVAPSN